MHLITITGTGEHCLNSDFLAALRLMAKTFMRHEETKNINSYSQLLCKSCFSVGVFGF
jgi:hypothetical protein